MCKYCDEMRIKGISDDVLFDNIQIGIAKNGLTSIANMVINDDGIPAMQFAIGDGQIQGGQYDVYVDDVPIQYCPFCGQKFDFKELAE